MSYKWTVLFLIVAIIFLVILSQENFTSQVEVQHQPKNDTVEINKSKTKKVLINNEKLKVPKEQKQAYTSSFDADPFVNEYIILSKYQNCMIYFKPVKSIFGMTVTPNKNTKRQQKRLDEYYKYCEQEKKKYPFYFEQDIYSFALKVEKTKTQSKLGQLIAQDFVKRAQQSYKESYQTLKSSHPNIMLNAINLLGTGFTEEVLYPSLQEILRSHDKKYIRSIANYTQNLYACSQGADCGLNSTLMINYCKINEDFCVDTFEELLETRLSFAQQTDIALASQYYASLFDENKSP